MLIKSKLLKIPVAKLDKFKKESDDHYFAVAHSNGEVLTIEFYKKKAFYCRFFTDCKNHIFYLAESGEFCKKSDSTIFGYGYYYKTEASEESTKRVKEFFESAGVEWEGKELITIISNFLFEKSRERTRKARNARETRIDNAMSLFPEREPKGFKKWIAKKFYNRKIFDENPRKKVFKEKRRVIICHKSGEKTLFQWVTVSIEAAREARNPVIVLEDDHRIVRAAHQDKHYDFKDIYPWGPAWREYKYSYDDAAFVFPGNLHEVFGEKYHNIDLTAEMDALKEPVHFLGLLDNLNKFPQTEYFVKMGLSRLAARLSEDNFKRGNDFTSVLGVSKQYLPIYRELQISKGENSIFQQSKTFITAEDFLKFRKFKLDYERTNLFCNLLENNSFERLVNYFTNQNRITKKAVNELLTFYRDYIQMSTDLNIDMRRKSVRFPKNIKEAHDRVMEAFNVVKTEIEDRNFKTAIKNLYAGLTDYRDENYAIVFPKSKTDFFREGQELSHCVGTSSVYYNEHIKGEKMIFFVRKLPDIDKAYATMQIDMRKLTITMISGYGNSQVNKETRDFANKFLKLLSKEKKTNESRSKRTRKETQTA